MAKARIFVRGNVQGVGYRALLLHMARRLKIKGLTRNLKDGNVEIFCEGPKKNIGQFLKAIEVKGDPEDLFSLHVEGTECFWEGEEGYQAPWKQYEDFEIDYGVRMSEYQYLAMEDREYGKLYLSNLMRTQKETTKEVRGLTQAEKETKEEIQNLTHAQKETTKGIRNLTQAEKETKTEIHNRFDEMKNSYDKISKQIAVLENVPKELQLLRKSIDKFLDAFLQTEKGKS